MAPTRCIQIGAVLSIRYSGLGTPPVVCAAVAAVAFWAVGCGQSPTSPAADSSKTPLPTGQVHLVRADGQALRELIAKHQGQVVLVDYWATWCGPCVENFPHTVALAKKYRDQGLATISVSFDRLDDEPRVREFLAQNGAGFDNVISQHDAVGQKTFADFDVGPLPEYRLYDRQGKLAKKWEGGVDQSELETKIAQLLGESSAQRGVSNAE